MSEENKAVSHRFHQAIGRGSAEAVQAELAPNYSAHFPGIPGSLDAEGFKQLVNVFGTAFPDSDFEIDEEFSLGDKVVTRWTYHGVHKGEFQGLPPTGKQIAMTGITILHIVAGKVVVNSVEMNQLGLLQQLGAIPSSG